MEKKVIKEYFFGIIFIVLILVELNTNLFSKNGSANSKGFVIQQESKIYTDSLNSGQEDYDEAISDFDRQEY
ncbi:hypothetical protein ACFLTI_09940 [Bacteroidota bacterium]